MEKIRLHQADLPDLEHYQIDCVAIDTETLGLNAHRDRLCVVQLSPGDGSAAVVQIPKYSILPVLISLFSLRHSALGLHRFFAPRLPQN